MLAPTWLARSPKTVLRKMLPAVFPLRPSSRMSLSALSPFAQKEQAFQRALHHFSVPVPRVVRYHVLAQLFSQPRINCWLHRTWQHPVYIARPRSCDLPDDRPEREGSNAILKHTQVRTFSTWDREPHHVLLEYCATAGIDTPLQLQSNMRVQHLPIW